MAGSDAPAPDHVASGSSLTLRIEGVADRSLEDVTVGLAIRRATDQLLVYSGHVDQRELAQAARITSPFALEFDFTAHLTRGMYSLSVFVLHNPTQQFLLPTQQVGVLGVNEQRSWEGVADVALRTRLAAPRSIGEATTVS
jgi:hypothetical protein